MRTGGAFVLLGLVAIGTAAPWAGAFLLLVGVVLWIKS